LSGQRPNPLEADCAARDSITALVGVWPMADTLEMADGDLSTRRGRGRIGDAGIARELGGPVIRYNAKVNGQFHQDESGVTVRFHRQSQPSEQQTGCAYDMGLCHHSSADPGADSHESRSSAMASAFQRSPTPRLSRQADCNSSAALGRKTKKSSAVSPTPIADMNIGYPNTRL